MCGAVYRVRSAGRWTRTSHCWLRTFAGDPTESTNSCDNDHFPFSRRGTLGHRSWRSEASWLSCSSLCPISQGCRGGEVQVEEGGEQVAGSRVFTKKSLTTNREKKWHEISGLWGWCRGHKSRLKNSKSLYLHTIRRKGKARRPHHSTGDRKTWCRKHSWLKGARPLVHLIERTILRRVSEAGERWDIRSVERGTQREKSRCRIVGLLHNSRKAH